MTFLQFHWRIEAMFERRILVHNFRLTCGHIHDFMLLVVIIFLVDVIVV